MKFSFGGSLGDWWRSGEKALGNWDTKIGGKFGGITSSLKQTSEYMQSDKFIGGTIGEQLLHRPLREGELQTDWYKGLSNLDRTTMGWSRQASPLWEGGLTKPGGTTQDIFGTEEQGGLLATWLNKAGHHAFGQKRAGYGSSGSSSSGGGNTSSVVSTDTEDPSLINQGNWQNAATIDSYMRRVNQQFNAGIETDLAATQRGRLKAANIS